MELLLAILAVARQAPELLAAIQALGEGDPTPEFLAQWESKLDESTIERNAIIEAARARLAAGVHAPPPAIEP